MIIALHRNTSEIITIHTHIMGYMIAGVGHVLYPAPKLHWACVISLSYCLLVFSLKVVI